MAFQYILTGPVGSKGTIGLIVLQADETIEQDFRKLFPVDEEEIDVAIHVSRIPSGAELTTDTIAQMERDLPYAVSLLPHGAEFDVIGYACTSGSALIGPDKVEAMVMSSTKANNNNNSNNTVTTRAVTNPLTAVFAALEALNVRSIAIVSPYVDYVADSMRTAFEKHGFAVLATLSFGEQVEARVARIDPASIREAAIQVAADASVDAVFLSCTNLRTLDIIDGLEKSLGGRPVISSNQALAWHMARLAGVPVWAKAPGRLFKTSIQIHESSLPRRR